MKSISYNGYVIEITSTPSDWKYKLIKNEQLIAECGISFASPVDAEIHAKLYIDRLIGKKDGWIIS